MRRVAKRTKLILWAAALASFAALFAYANHCAQVQEEFSFACQKEALKATATGLIAIRNGDLRTLKAVLYTGSVEWLGLDKAPSKRAQAVARTSATCQLKSLTDRRIRDSLEICDKQPELLLTTILQTSVTPRAWKKLVQTPVDGLLVECNLPKHALVIMCVREGGSWKMLGFPELSAKILRYRTIYDASAHNDAIAE